MNIDISKLNSNENTKDKIKDVIVIMLFTIAMIISSYIKIPAFPVPFTMQTFVVVLSAFMIPNKKACIVQIIYLLYGIAGKAVFASGGGLGYITSPTFGYILGFIVMAYIISSIIDMQNKTKITFRKLISIGIIGVLIQHIIGITYLYAISNIVLNTNISILDVIVKGSIIFLPYDILKVIFAGSIKLKTVKNNVRIF